MAKFNRTICSICHKVFVKQFDEEICHACVIDEAERDICRERGKSRMRRCKNCGNKFEVITQFACQKAREYCSSACRPHGKVVEKPVLTDNEKRIKKANERWVSGKKNLRSRPLQTLINQSEHRRVWDDRGWNHFLKGRRWDRV